MKSFIPYLFLVAMVLAAGCNLGWDDESDGMVDPIPDVTDSGDGPIPDTPGDSPCHGGLVDCGGECVDTQANHSHCGSCGSACEAEQVCSGGECLFECPPGTVACSGSCVDLGGDILNCGSCGNVCEAGERAEPVCEGGVCSVICEEGWSDLDGNGSCETNCVPSSPTEECDGLDNNCDGRIDEGFECKMGLEVACSTVCDSMGTAICGIDCTVPPPSSCNPPEETCNGEDDDCDHECDNGFACCRFTTGSCTTSCGTDGTRVCSSSCTFDTCVPPAETCNGEDDNCDGECDNGSGMSCCRAESESCSTSCGTTGTRDCSSSCVWGSCDPPEETCDGSDEDCDGTADEGADCRIAVYRFACPSDHFYKNDSSTPGGCTYEGVGWYNYASAVSGSSFSTTAMYMLYHSGGADHLYTISAEERDSAIAGGYTLEGNIGYCSPSGASGTTQLYRLHSSSANDHFYTTSAAERDSAASGEYVYEGVACHVWTSP